MLYVLAPTGTDILHSAKGSEWKKHIYIKRDDGKYYYPDSYKGGRHLPKGDGSSARNKSTGPKGTYSEYNKDDPDFDMKNYSEADRIAGTNFFMKKKDDGSYVVVCEDEKWTVPAGADISELKEKLRVVGNIKGGAEFEEAVYNLFKGYKSSVYNKDGGSESSAQEFAIATHMSSFTGMKESACLDLIKIAKEKGYDSKEYREECMGLAEGDEDQYKKITHLLELNIGGKAPDLDADNNKEETKATTTSKKTSTKKASTKNTTKNTTKTETKKDEKKEETTTSKKDDKEWEKKQRSRISANYKKYRESLKHSMLSCGSYILRPTSFKL